LKPIEKDFYSQETYFEYGGQEYIVQFETTCDSMEDSWEPIHGNISYREVQVVDLDQMAVYTMDGKFVKDFGKLYETAADVAQDEIV
jgi:hypothetical protein